MSELNQFSSSYYNQTLVGSTTGTSRGNKQSQCSSQIQRYELVAISDRYQRISDAIEGEHAVKYRKDKYLPVPSSCGGRNTDKRYKAYQTLSLIHI